MSMDTLFSICNFAVLPFWILLLFAPGWKWTQRIVHTFMLPMALAVVYLVLAVMNFFGGEGGFGSLEGVMTLFEEPGAVMAGWIHYLVFDLFIGAWEVRDARRLKIPHLAVMPCLVFTFMLGPVGLLLYLILRWSMRRAFVLDETPAAA